MVIVVCVSLPGPGLWALVQPRSTGRDGSNGEGQQARGGGGGGVNLAKRRVIGRDVIVVD